MQKIINFFLERILGNIFAIFELNEKHKCENLILIIYLLTVNISFVSEFAECHHRKLVSSAHIKFDKFVLMENC